MDKCPKCGDYNLDYDFALEAALCTGCGFTEEMGENAYILLYGTLEHYACFGSKHLEDRIAYISKFHINRQKRVNN
jgi:hypothetical protein